MFGCISANTIHVKATHKRRNKRKEHTRLELTYIETFVTHSSFKISSQSHDAVRWAKFSQLFLGILGVDHKYRAFSLNNHLPEWFQKSSNYLWPNTRTNPWSLFSPWPTFCLIFSSPLPSLSPPPLLSPSLDPHPHPSFQPLQWIQSSCHNKHSAMIAINCYDNDPPLKAIWQRWLCHTVMHMLITLWNNTFQPFFTTVVIIQRVFIIHSCNERITWMFIKLSC